MRGRLKEDAQRHVAAAAPAAHPSAVYTKRTGRLPCLPPIAFSSSAIKAVSKPSLFQAISSYQRFGFTSSHVGSQRRAEAHALRAHGRA